MVGIMNNLIRKISQHLGMPPMVVFNFLHTASHRYKVFEIKKRTHGFRTIAQPAKPIKAIQRFLINEVFDELPVHTSATAYKEGTSIKENAEKHKSNKFMLKMDFTDFFPSIRTNDVKMHLRRYLPDIWTEDEIKMMAHACLWKPKREGVLRLSIGAPSSPFLSNSIMFDFDTQIAEICGQEEIVYTRYADDLCFSTNHPNILSSIEDQVKQILGQLPYPLIRINERKTVHTSMKKRRFITGIVITNEGNISLGRERKRDIRVKLHKALNSELDNSKLLNLNGLLSFAKDIEPHFWERMKQKFGEELFNEIKNTIKEEE